MNIAEYQNEINRIMGVSISIKTYEIYHYTLKQNFRKHKIFNNLDEIEKGV